MLDVSHLLGLLQEDPDHDGALAELREAIESGDPSRVGPDPLRLVSAARRAHQERGETSTAVALLELEAALSASDPDREAQLRKELARIHREDLLDDAAARAAYERARALRPGDDEIAEALEALDTAEQSWKEIASAASTIALADRMNGLPDIRAIAWWNSRSTWAMVSGVWLMSSKRAAMA